MDVPLDPYLVLGVSRTASRADIANAYRQLVRRYHPDSRASGAHTADSDTALMRIMAAHMILEDPDRRAEYDRQHPEPRVRSHHYPPTPLTWIGRRPNLDLRVGPVRWH
jgi:DnaJ-class molecular chaperone